MSGTDEISYYYAPNPVRVDMNGTRANIYAESKSDFYDSIENSRGSQMDDIMIGDSLPNSIWGENGK
jgi:hypothetical protein